MTDGIIVAILIVVFFIGFSSTVKHFAKRSGCCGGSEYTSKKKKLSAICCALAVPVGVLVSKLVQKPALEAIKQFNLVKYKDIVDSEQLYYIQAYEQIYVNKYPVKTIAPLKNCKKLKRLFMEFNTEDKSFLPEDFDFLDEFKYQCDRKRNFTY